MSDSLQTRHYDTVVVGGGSAGLAAAVGAGRNGAKTLLIDAGPTIGGELLTGMTIDGAINARGEWVIGGVLDELIAELKRMGGYVGAYCDWRLINYVCIDPVIMQVAVMNVLRKHNVDILLYTFAEEVVTDGDRIAGIIVRNKSGRTLLTADAFVDCSGDGDISALAGADHEIGDPSGELQPVSLMFRLMGVENEPLLSFVREHPEHVAVGESEVIRGGRTDKELVEEIYKQGQPTVFFKGDGPLMSEAIDRGDMFPTALIMIQPTSVERKEVCVNATRISQINALNTSALSGTMGALFDQIEVCTKFLKGTVPGFESAHIAGIAPRIGIRETRRILGEYVLTKDDVMNGRKFDDGVAKGCHHIDIHQDGIKQVRIAVANGGSYDIPFGSLLPRNLSNVLVAGRCFSADRPAHGSARLMGSCLAMGQATGTAAAMFSDRKLADMREVPVQELRATLMDQGAVLEGTH